MNGSNSEIAIIGANLYGCITAARLSIKYPKKKITIYDNGKDILESFKSIELQNYKLNNGFHAIELPRAKNLVKFLAEEIKVPFQFFPNVRDKVIENFYVKENLAFDNYPKNLKKFYKKKNFKSKNYRDFLLNSSEKFKKIIFKVAKRYNTNFMNVAHFFIPWFYPNEYIFLSDDEGEKFRNEVRSGVVKPYFAIPKNGKVESLRKYFKKYFKKKKIYLSLNSQILNNKNLLAVKSKGSISNLNQRKIYMCVPPFFLINNLLKKNITKNYKFLSNVLIKLPSKYKKKNFTEIIFCSSNFPNLGRITNTNYFIKNKNQLLQAELILPKFVDLNENLLKKKFYFELKKVFPKITINELKILDFKITRKVFYPDNKFIKKFKTNVLSSIKKLKNNIFYNFFLGPINMSKQWKFSEIFLRGADK